MGDFRAFLTEQPEPAGGQPVQAGKARFAGEMVDRYVLGGVTVLGKRRRGRFEVHSIVSVAEGVGEASAMIGQLRSKFGAVVAVDPVPGAVAFWEKMKERGLIDGIVYSQPPSLD